MSKPMIEIQLNVTSKSGDMAQQVIWRQWYPDTKVQSQSQFPLYQGIDELVQEISAKAMVANGLEDTRN